MTIEDWSFSQIRGTPRNTVGAISRRSAWMVRIDSAKFTVTPRYRLRNTLKICSATWHRGR